MTDDDSNSLETLKETLILEEFIIQQCLPLWAKKYSQFQVFYDEGLSVVHKLSALDAYNYARSKVGMDSE